MPQSRAMAQDETAALGATAQPEPMSAKQKLLEATLETIDEVGIAHTTTRLIAERAGVNLQLIQYHFGGKDGLLQEAQLYIVTRFFETVGPQVSGAPDLTAAIRAGLEATWRLAREKPALVQPDLLLQTLRAQGEEPDSPGEDRSAPDDERPGERETHRRVRGLLSDVMERSGDELRVPLDDFVVLVVSGLSGLVLEYRTGCDEAQVDAAMDLFASVLETCVIPAERAQPQ